MKTALLLLALACAFLIYKIFKLESELEQLQRNTAIAVLSAELANKKVGAIAPYFGEDKEAFANAWIDDFNMPLAEFPDSALGPIRTELAKKRVDPVSVKLKEATFGR
jgi:hypothetical protein